jgi:xylulokinase
MALWLEAVDLVLQRLQQQEVDFGRIKGISGAGMQHGIVCWSSNATELLEALKPDETLASQLPDAFAHPFSPNWQDQSTQAECEAFDAVLGSPTELANVTGSKAHHRFSGPQIMRFRKLFPDRYEATTRISLVSSFLASIFVGGVAPIDCSDVCGMNLWDISNQCWSKDLVQLAAGESGSESLIKKLGQPTVESTILESVSEYFMQRYGFTHECHVSTFTGDNPATLLGLPMDDKDAIVSLGTSTTFLMATNTYKPSPEYHVMNHPTMSGLYMFMLCYKNGSLARERIRDQINQKHDGVANSWSEFNRLALQGSHPRNHIGLYFPLQEIVPAAPAGTWRGITSENSIKLLSDAPGQEWNVPDDDAAAILVSQCLSMRMRSASQLSTETQNARPRRLFLAGGASVNPAIASVAKDVLGPTDGVFRLSLGANACALGAAYKAAWQYAVQTDSKQLFQEFVGNRWNEAEFIVKVSDGPDTQTWAKYGDLLGAFQQLETIATGSC